MNEIVKAKNQNLMPSHGEMQNFIQVAGILGNCPYYAKKGAGGVLAIWLAARELGLPVMMCLNGGMHVIEGCVTLSAQLINMMIVNAGHRADVLYLNQDGCKIRFVRGDRQKGNGDTFEYEFAMADAVRAGYFGIKGEQGSYLKKPKDNWINSPKDMFFARCLSGGARKFMPDALMNCYAIGEMPGDDKLESAMPDPALAKPIEPTIISIEQTEEPKAITMDNQSNEELATAFMAKHGIHPGSRKNEYVAAIETACAKSGKPRTHAEIIFGAMKNEAVFLEAYKTWELKQNGAKIEVIP